MTGRKLDSTQLIATGGLQQVLPGVRIVRMRSGEVVIISPALQVTTKTADEPAASLPKFEEGCLTATSRKMSNPMTSMVDMKA